MCANFRTLTHEQLYQLQTRLQQTAIHLPNIDFDYRDEIYPHYFTPLLFDAKSAHLQHRYEWRDVMFGLVPKWAENTDIAKHTYNARVETIFEKPSFQEAAHKGNFAVIPVSEFYESKYFDDQPQRWGVRRKDGQAFFIATLFEIAKVDSHVIRSATMLTMDAAQHPMMKEFHEPGHIKRSVIVIPFERLNEWLNLQSPQQLASFIQGFPADEFECSHVPKSKIDKRNPQLSLL